ncbi:PTS sugar transporter subunit IIA [Roseococcus sp. YIM B11640]|uniref:PTS sugar transporter subunit IIA n=1 Tax=Roseococcus sp. YIM B11640 TaxID=3133973 RepID=UPI003C7D7D23
MSLTDLFPGAAAVLDLAPADKAQLFQMLAGEAARRLGRDERDVLAALQSRERLGATGLGRGIGMPHARMEGLDQQVSLLARLAKPIEYDARDGEPVDLVFLVLWPEEQAEGFLPALSGICRALRAAQLPRHLRQADTPAEAARLLQEADAANPAEAP